MFYGSNKTSNTVDINRHFKYNLSAKSSDHCMILFHFTMMINMNRTFVHIIIIIKINK